MAPTKPGDISKAGSNKPIIGPNYRIYKTKRVRKLKNGLLNTSIPRKSVRLTETAQNNSIQSPLLALPGEIRNKIWQFALSGHQIDIRDQHRHKRVTQIIHQTRPEGSRYPLSNSYVRPKFQLPMICRQMYVETNSYVYTKNTFAFSSADAMDRWIKHRPLGQLDLITSIDVPMEYMRLYNLGFRTAFRKMFPALRRIGIDILVAYFSRCLSETMEDSKARIAKKVKSWEGENVKVEWHWGSNGPPLHYG